jgi:hypothetical protein
MRLRLTVNVDADRDRDGETEADEQHLADLAMARLEECTDAIVVAAEAEGMQITVQWTAS